jgi:hypothetical protein
MAQTGLLARRRPAEWVIRLGLAVLLAAIGYAGVRHALALTARRNNPAQAHGLAPHDGRITALLAERRFVEGRDASSQAAATRLARRALHQDPTAVEAVATLGLQAQVRGRTKEARRLFAYAQTLSRREIQTQLWAIEDAVARNDIPAALRHYDIALTTSKGAPDILFPVLTGALSEPTVRRSLVPILARRPVWASGFIAHAAGSTSDPLSVAALLQALARARVPLSATAQTGVVNNLILGGRIDEGWRYYASLRPNADRRRSRDADFSANLETPSVLDWIPVNDAGIAVSARDGVADFGVPPTSGGVLLRQIQLLPPGTYRLEGRSRGIEQAPRALPYWVLSCRDGREFGRVVVPNSAIAKGVFHGRLTVPRGCPMQTLALVARPSDEITGVTGQIDHVRLAPTE